VLKHLNCSLEPYSGTNLLRARDTVFLQSTEPVKPASHLQLSQLSVSVLNSMHFH
jgi:hypothetical protein